MRPVVMLCTRIFRNEIVTPGAVVEATPREAEVLIRTGQAAEHAPADAGPPDPPALRTAAADPVRRRAVRNGGKA